MDSINPLNVIKLLEWDYRPHHRMDDFPSQADKDFKQAVKGTVCFFYGTYRTGLARNTLYVFLPDFIDSRINQSHTAVNGIEEDLQYELQIDVETFEDLEKSVVQSNLLNGTSEADFDVTEVDRLGEPVSCGTEPSSHELYVPRLPNPKLPVDQLVNFDYKKRAVAYWRSTVKKKCLSLSRRVLVK